MRDMGSPGFWFDVRFGENLNHGALIVLTPQEMANVAEEANTYDVASLKDAPCQIEIDDTGHVKFVRVLK